MCQFLSAIIHKSGEVLHSPFTDSHEDLVRLFKLNDAPNVRGEARFARVEFRPEDMADADQPEKYILRIDEQRMPEWFVDAMKECVTDKLRSIIKGMIITGDVDLLVGGKYILAKGAKVTCVKNCLIEIMMDSSKVGVMRESSNVGVMRDSSKVGEMRESSKVGVMLGSSNVGVMWDSSKVGVMRESSNVGVMRDSSKVGVMRESSNVGVMRDSSKVGEMRESSKVGVMLGSSNVGLNNSTKQK